jgi:hypothetical protein
MKVVEGSQLQRKLDGAVRQAGEIFVDTVNQLVTETAAGGRIEFKRHDRI